MFDTLPLRNGVPVVLDSSLGLRSVTVCLAVGAGSRDDGDDGLGSSHLLEHLVMSAPLGGNGPSISKWVDGVGGQSNASTSKDALAYWARVPPEAATECVRRHLECVVSPSVTDALCDEERRVVAQELLSAAADPEDVAQESFYADLFGEHPMGSPVGGAPDRLRHLTARRVLDTHRRFLGGAPLCLAVVGPEDLRDALVDAVRASALAGLDRGGQSPVDARTVPKFPTRRQAAARQLLGPDAEYAYLVAGGMGATRDDELWPAFQVLSAAVGGTPGSPLYERLRGQLGLSYGLYSLHSAYSDCGVWRVVAGCMPEEVGRVERVVLDCLEYVAGGRLTAADLRAAVAQARGSVLLENEDPVALAHHNAYWGLVGLAGESPVRQALHRILSVPAADVSRAAGRVLESYTSVVA